MRTVRLKDVVEIQLGKMLSPKSKTGTRPMPYLRNANVQWDRFDLTDVSQMDFDLREEQKFLLRPGDILVCEGGEPGRAAVWDGQLDPCLYQKALHRLRPIRDAVDPHFLMYRLWLGAIRGEFSDGQGQTTIAHLPAVRLGEVLLAIPSIGEQRRIAATLNGELARVRDARSQTARIREQAADLTTQILRTSIPLPTEGRWPWVRLDQVAQFLDGMRRPVSETERAARIKGLSREQLIPYFGANGQAGWIDGYLFNEPLVLLAEDGGAFGSSRNPIAYRIDGKAWVNNHAHVLRPLPGLDVNFLGFALSVRPDVGEVISGSTRGKLNHSVAAAIQVPIPPIDDQRRIAEELRERLAIISAMERSIQIERDAIDALPAALLRLAFESVAA